MKQALVTWTGGMAFNARTGSEHNVAMDARADVGGENKGPRPTELLLAALGGCSGMDVVSILRKMRIEFDRFEIAIEAEEGPEHPKAFTAFTMVYRLWGTDVPPEKFCHAVDLSQERYCAVSGLFKKGAEVSYRLELNDQPLS